jgi:protein-S-isoprenylcysteine O-methyltransferase Ste14
MFTVDEMWVFFLIIILIVLSPIFIRRIHLDYKTNGELSKKSAIFNFILFGLFFMTTLNAALYTRWVFAPNNLLYKYFGAAFISVGILIITEAFIEFRSFRRVNGLQADKVISTGVYRFSRNPQYLAMFLFLIGFSLIYRSIIAFTLTPIFMVIVNVVIIPGEEKYLEKTLGEKYIQYKKKVRRWV